MKKRIVRCICVLWTILGILLLISIFVANNLNDDTMKNLISKIVLIYALGGCVIAGVIAYLRKKTK